MAELASVASETHASPAWRGSTLEARCLTPTEVTDRYLPLRYDVLRRELRWTVGNVRKPADMRDAYDRESVAFGVLAAKTRLIAAERLIISAGQTGLPSLRLLHSLGREPRVAFPAAEISRVMVRRDSRKLRFFPVLLMSSLLLARHARIRTLLISERDDPRFGLTMAAFGFGRVAEGFSFVDDIIAPDEPAATYALDMCRFDEEAWQAIVARRRGLLRAADSVFTAGSDRRGQEQRLPGIMVMGDRPDIAEARVEHQLAGVSGADARLRKGYAG
jgi:hypothetical protein